MRGHQDHASSKLAGRLVVISFANRCRISMTVSGMWFPPNRGGFPYAASVGSQVTGALVLAVTTFPGHALGSRHGASVAVRCSRRATYRGGMGPKVAGVMILLATVVVCSSGTPPPVGGSSAGGPS